MIAFDLSLYSEDAVLRAIQDYKGIAEIEYKATQKNPGLDNNAEKQIECVISHSMYDIETTRLEFCNYVLSLTISMGGFAC